MSRFLRAREALLHPQDRSPEPLERRHQQRCDSEEAEKPTTSVTVVKMIDEDCAGSWRSAVSAIGMTAPENPASVIDRTIDMPMTRVNPAERLQR